MTSSSTLLASLLQVGDSAMLKTRFKVDLEDDVDDVADDDDRFGVENVAEFRAAVISTKFVDDAALRSKVATSPSPPPAPGSEGTCFLFNLVMDRFFSKSSVERKPSPLLPPPLLYAAVAIVVVTLSPLMFFRCSFSSWAIAARF